jgi:hypothetical protein
MHMRSFLSTEGRQGLRWLVLWIVAAATAAIGVILLYLGPNVVPGGKGSVPSPLLAQAPPALIAIGMVGVVLGAIGIARSRWRAAATTSDDRSFGHGSVGVRMTRLADSAAIGGFVVAAAALLAVILVELVWPVVASTMRAGPCDQNPTVACFRAHPDYYQETGPGSGGYSTPVSRIGDDILTPILLSAWPLGLAAAVVGVIALATGTNRRRLAILAVVLGTAAVAGMGLQYLAFLVSGGD